MKKLLSTAFAVVLVLCMVSCADSNKVPTLNRTKMVLYVNESTTLQFSGGNDNCYWCSDNGKIADVTNGKVTAYHVGETDIHANSLTCHVIVKPTNTSFTEPCLDFGKDISNVKAFMSGYQLKSESSTNLTYYGKGSIDLYSYSFKNGKLSMSAFIVPDLLKAESLADFLSERYILADKGYTDGDYMYIFASVDMSIIVQLRVGTYGFLVMYARMD